MNQADLLYLEIIAFLLVFSGNGGVYHLFRLHALQKYISVGATEIQRAFAMSISRVLDFMLYLKTGMRIHEFWKIDLRHETWQAR